MITTTDIPARNLRVQRCFSGHGYFAYPGSDPIGCPVCGKGLTTTTRQQRQQPWQVLDRAEALEASRLPGGLPEQIVWERERLDSYMNRVAEALLDDEGTLEIEDGTSRFSNYRAGDRIYRKDYSLMNLDAALREGDRLLAKIAKLERKLEKLGGPKTA